MPRRRRLIGLPHVKIVFCGDTQRLYKGRGHWNGCYSVLVKKEGRFELIYHDYMKRWEVKPWWRKVWDYVIRKRQEKQRPLSIRS